MSDTNENTKKMIPRIMSLIELFLLPNNIANSLLPVFIPGHTDNREGSRWCSEEVQKPLDWNVAIVGVNRLYEDQVVDMSHNLLCLWLQQNCRLFYKFKKRISPGPFFVLLSLREGFPAQP